MTPTAFSAAGSCLFTRDVSAAPLMEAALLKVKLKNLIQEGCLRVTWPSGRVSNFGRSEIQSPMIAIRLTGMLLPIKLLLNPHLYLGEAYMNGRLGIDRGTLWDFMDLLCRNLSAPRENIFVRVTRPVFNYVTQYNSRRSARRNVSHHYDLSSALYRLFLDDDLQYSCAYFPRPNISIDAAQEAKKRLLIRKLQLRPGQRVLDIGCGWGGLALSLAKAEDVEILGVTLSKEQLQVARQRAAESGLSNRVRFELLDFRDVPGTFDRIISVGMFEHVGIPNYKTFFAQIQNLLTPAGIAVLHSIGHMHGPSTTSSWIQKYIFPGGYIPALSEVLPHVERSGLWMTDLEILRLHYANTLRLWRERFLSSRSAARRLYDERFCRMWEYYLVSSEMGFRYGGLMVFQMQFSKMLNSVPLTRGYLLNSQQDEKPFFEFPHEHRAAFEASEASMAALHNRHPPARKAGSE